MPSLGRIGLPYIKALGRSTAGRTIAGAGIGAAYGAYSDRTSVLGGALMGAGAARYGYAGMRRARYYGSIFNRVGKFGSSGSSAILGGRLGGMAANFAYGAGLKAARDMRFLGRASAIHIGSGMGKMKRAFNGFRTLGRNHY